MLLPVRLHWYRQLHLHLQLMQHSALPVVAVALLLSQSPAAVQPLLAEPSCLPPLALLLAWLKP